MVRIRYLKYIITLLILNAQFVWAGSLYLPYDKNYRPAKELIYQGQIIDADTVAQLKKSGFDISTLNPAESDVWVNERLPFTNEEEHDFPTAETPRLVFDSVKAANRLKKKENTSKPTSADSQGVFLARVLDGNKPYHLAISLNLHPALMRAAALRAMGYQIPSPKYYKKVTVVFENDSIILDEKGKPKIFDDTKKPDYETRRVFRDGFAYGTRRGESRWIVDYPEDRSEVTVIDVLLETARIEVPTFQWGLIKESHLGNLRPLRALIVPMTLFDLSESVNLYSWDCGYVFNDSGVLVHPQATVYGQTTIDDARWIMKKLAVLTREDFSQIVALGKYPPDISQLLLEKVISRRNSLVQLLKLKPSELAGAPLEIPYTTHVNIGNIVNGKLMQENYPGYAQRFSWGDPESPLTTAELTRYGAMMGLSSGIGQAIGEINKHLQILTVGDAVDNHMSSIKTSLINHFKSNPTQPYEGKVKTWGGPLFNFGIEASRNIVTGTYYGLNQNQVNKTPLQLVDVLGARISVGHFLAVDTLSPNYLPTVSANINIGRNYVHVRPVASVKAAMEEGWGNLFIPGFMNGLGDIMKLDEIMQGADPDTLSKEDLEKKAEALSTAVAKFMLEFREGEVLTITDTLSPDVTGTIRFPLAAFLPVNFKDMNPMITLNTGVNAVILRRTTITRTSDSLHVYLQNLNSKALRFSIDARFWIKMLEVARQNKTGHISTRAFIISADPKGFRDNFNLASAMDALLKDNNAEPLERNYSPYKLKHNLTSETTKGGFLFWSRFNLNRGHELNVMPPEDPDKRYDPKDFTRTLYAKTTKQFVGMRFLNTISDVVGYLTERESLIFDNPGPNPAHSFMGQSVFTEMKTDAEITKGVLENPVNASVQSWQGWILSQAKLMKILNRIDEQVRPADGGIPIIHREAFNMTEDLQFYDVRASLLIHKGGIGKLIDALIGSAERPPIFIGEKSRLRRLDDKFTATDPQLVEVFKDIMGREEYGNYCRRIAPEHKHKLNSWLMNANHFGYKHECLTDWMVKLLNLRRSFPEEPKAQIDWINDVVSSLIENLRTGSFLNWLGKQNFFFQVKVSGFRTKDENGDSEYYSSALGTLGAQYNPGVFKEFINKYKILENEVEGSYFDEGN